MAAEKTPGVLAENDVTVAGQIVSFDNGQVAAAHGRSNANIPTLFVPASSVATDQQHTIVVRVQNKTAQWVTVQTGQTVKGEIEVFGDLKPGDLVIKAASDAIHSGEKMQTSSR